MKQKCAGGQIANISCIKNRRNYKALITLPTTTDDKKIPMAPEKV